MRGRWVTVWSRGLRSEPLRSVGVGILILVTVLIATSVPRVLNRASDNALHQEVAAAASTVRNLELVQDGQIDAGSTDPLEPVRAAGLALQAHYPVQIPAVTSAVGLVIDTPLWHPSVGTPLDTVMNLRIQADVDAHIKLVSGRLPTGATTTIPDPTPGASKDSVLTVLEVAASSETAAKLSVPVGGRLILQPEPSDPLGADRGVRLAVDLVGTYDVTDPTEAFWMDDQSVDHTYTYALQKFVEYVGATMLLAPEAYPALLDATRSSGLPMIYHWRSYVDPALIESSQLDPLAAALRRAETIYPPATPVVGNGGSFSGPDRMSRASLRTGLLGLIAAHQARWQSGATILAILWTGAGLVMLASLALVAEMIARRRSAALLIVGRRGASSGQIRTAILSESIVLVLPGAIIGTILAVILVPDSDPGPTLLVAGLVTVVAIGLMALATRRYRNVAVSTRVRRFPRVGSGRLVAEALVVGLAIVGAVLLHGRNAASVSSDVGADPFLAAAPALVGLAAGIIAVRLLPVILGLLARLVGRGRGLVAVLGIRRAARDGGIAAVLVVALTATAVGTFASALLDQINAGAASASWQTAGAEFQVTGLAAYLELFETRHPSGVQAEAAISIVSVAVSTGGVRNLIVVDPATLAAVSGGSPADPGLPAAMAGAAGNAAPVIVSSGAEGSSPIAAGQSFSVRIGGGAVPLQAVAVRDSFPAAPPGQPFVVVSSAQLSVVSQGFAPEPTALLLRALGVSLGQIQADVSDLPGLTVVGRAATETTIRNAPVVAAVSLGILSGAVAVLVYGLLTVVLAIALGTAGRRTETARLQILGLSNRQSVWLVLVEFAPAVLAGVLVGLGLGIVLVEFVGPGLDLPAVLGVPGLASSTPDFARLALLALATLALIAIATLLSSLLERQRQLATAVRDGTQ